jgi:hypothetical protein
LAEETVPGNPARSGDAESDRPVLADAEATKWVSRFEKLLPKGWSVSRDTDVFTIERNEPVQSINEINRPPATENETPEEREAREKSHVLKVAYRIKLKFAPRISQDQFEELAAVNKTTLAEAEKLRAKMKLRNIDHKFNAYIPRNAEERERLASYNDAVRKLPYHDLPDCYSPDCSVYYQSGWPAFTRLYEKDEYYECLHVEHSLLRLFGVYSVALAKAGFPRWSSDPQDSAAQRGLVEVTP